MERLLKPYDKEVMKLAMLKHEETFKEQVHELHRLYRIQKSLMRSINQERWHSGSGICLRQINEYRQLDLNQRRGHHGHTGQRPELNLDLQQQPAEGQYVSGSDRRNGAVEIEDESAIELTLGPPSYNPARKKKLDTPPASDSGRSFSSSSTGSSHTAREDQVMMGRTMGLDVEERVRLERAKQQPPWLVQVLSLNI